MKETTLHFDKLDPDEVARVEAAGHHLTVDRRFKRNARIVKETLARINADRRTGKRTGPTSHILTNDDVLASLK